jgi:hypothetical protein
MSDLETSGQDTPEPRSPGTLQPPEIGHEKYLRTHSGAARRRILKATNELTDALIRKNTYAYKNINCENQIRVLKVFPGKPGPETKILCCLVTCPLVDQGVPQASQQGSLIRYEALSYCWGEEEPENEVYMFETEEAYKEWRKTDKNGVLLTSLLSISLWITGHFAYKQPLKEKLKFLRNGINK